MKKTILDKDLCRESWLEVAGPHRFGIGCRICRKARRCKGVGFDITPWERCGVAGCSLQWAHVQRHQRCNKHKAAARSHCLAFQRIESLPGVPSVDEFLKVLKAVPQTLMIEGMARKKVKTMLWCLGEAARAHQRACLRRTVAIAVHQDGRQGMLLTRYVSVDNNLTMHRGVLYVDRSAEQDATTLH